MTDRMINKAWIQAKSEQLNIPYESVLAGYVMEELACLLADSSYGSRFLLKNPHVLRLSAWEKGCHRNLCYFYVTDSEEALKKSELAVILKETVKWEKQT